MSILGYARTTFDTTDTTQLAQTLTAFGCDSVTEEFALAGEKNSGKLNTLIKALAPGDTLVVTQLNQLGKSTRQLTQLTEALQNRQAHLVSLHEKIDTREAMGPIYFNLMEGLATMECDLIKERTLVGLNEARKKGKVGGRPKTDPKVVKKIRRLYYDKNESIQLISSKCQVSVGTCYKYVNLSEAELAKIVG